MRKKIIIGCLVIVCVIAVYSFGWPYVDLAKRKNALKKYDVQKEWKDNSLKYEDAKHYVRTYTSETEYTDELKSENGSGLFYLNSANEILWEDKVDNAGENCVFISVE